MKIIDINNLTKRFGSTVALNSINLTVHQGEIFGFIGPNGAGKSTTIRILLGMLKANAGDAKIFDLDVFKDSLAIHKRIAYVPAEVNLWPSLTGGEVIDILMSLSGITNLDKRDLLLKKFDLDPTKKCGTYSKGNRQKVALVAALSSDADLYIFDEPTSGLDPLMEKVFQDEVYELKKLNKTVFLSSHILSEVEKLCDRVAIIKEGVIIESGSLSDLRHLTRMKMIVETKLPLIDIINIKGVYDIQQLGKAVTFNVDFDCIDEVMRYVSEKGIIKIESNPPTLEDLFLRFYLNQEEDSYAK